MGTVDKAIEAINGNDLQALDDIWTDMVLDETLSLAVLFGIAKRLKETGQTDHALLLLDMLAAHYESSTMYGKAIEVYRQTAYYRKDTTGIREKIGELYRKQYRESAHIDDYIHASALLTADSLFKALDKLDEYLAYDVGQYFYFERYGLGQVIETDPEQREIIIDFEKKKRHFLTLDIARGLLMPVGHEHFLYKKAKHTDELTQMAADHPQDLVLLLLRSMKQPMTSAQIKRHLTGIIEEKSIAGFWERTRKTLEKNTRIRVKAKPHKTFAVIESGADRSELARAAFMDASPHEQYALAEEYSRTMPEVFSSIGPLLVRLGNNMVNKDPALALDTLLLCTRHSPDLTFAFTLDSILDGNDDSLVTQLRTPSHQKTVLEYIQNQHPDEWPRIFKQLVFTGTEHKLLDELGRFLSNAPDVLQDTYRTIFSFPKKYPHQYRWMLKKMQAGDLSEYLQPSFLPRMIDSLDQVKGIKATVHKILMLERFDDIIKHASRDEAQRILKTVNTAATLEDYRKHDYERIIRFHHPTLFKTQRIDIYTTEPALLMKKEELEHLLAVEVPANKKEISRARDFGDLSENFEYKAAKEKQGQLLEKVRVLQSDLEQAQIIDRDTIDTSRVSIGTRVTLTHVGEGTELQYTILGRWDTDLEKNVISNEAPVAQALLGKPWGDRVRIHDGEYEITRIDRAL
jgi:transcription elongation factor GreA